MKIILFCFTFIILASAASLNLKDLGNGNIATSRSNQFNGAGNIAFGENNKFQGNYNLDIGNNNKIKGNLNIANG